MPLYEYQCADCGTFVCHRTVLERDVQSLCPACSAPASRVLAFPNLALMPRFQREAMRRNERSQHEPAVQERHRCSSRCACASPAKTQPAAGKKAGSPLKKARRGQRPWMLGH